MRSQHILIADDETNIRLMLRTVLTTDGYTVEEVTDGRAALAAIAKRVPDLMILDLSMPLLDGFGVLQELKGLRPAKKPRVIVMTAYGSISTAVKATRLGAMDFLEKPVTPDEIRETVAAVLSESRPNNGALVEPGGDALGGGYEAVLDRVRKLLRLANYADAESLMMKAADLSLKDAAYFNLIGVLYEVQREWRLAAKFYDKALDVNPRYEPAQKNLRRIPELKRHGQCNEPVALGDERDLMYARLPDNESAR